MNRNNNKEDFYGNKTKFATEYRTLEKPKVNSEERKNRGLNL
jgi:hypothetical protein